MKDRIPAPLFLHGRSVARLELIDGPDWKIRILEPDDALTIGDARLLAQWINRVGTWADEHWPQPPRDGSGRMG